MRIVFVLGEQFFERDMHTVVPEMTRISRDIDSVGVLIFDTDITIDSEPVLQRENHPHSGTIHVLIDDKLCYLGRHLSWCFALPPHLLVVEALCNDAVFFPPSA